MNLQLKFKSLPTGQENAYCYVNEISLAQNNPYSQVWSYLLPMLYLGTYYYAHHSLPHTVQYSTVHEKVWKVDSVIERQQVAMCCRMRIMAIWLQEMNNLQDKNITHTIGSDGFISWFLQRVRFEWQEHRRNHHPGALILKANPYWLGCASVLEVEAAGTLWWNSRWWLDSCGNAAGLTQPHSQRILCKFREDSIVRRQTCNVLPRIMRSTCQEMFLIS